MKSGRRPEEAVGKKAEKKAEKEVKKIAENGGLRKRNRYFVWHLEFF